MVSLQIKQVAALHLHNYLKEAVSLKLLNSEQMISYSSSILQLVIECDIDPIFADHISISLDLLVKTPQGCSSHIASINFIIKRINVEDVLTAILPIVKNGLASYKGIPSIRSFILCIQYIFQSAFEIDQFIQEVYDFLSLFDGIANSTINLLKNNYSRLNITERDTMYSFSYCNLIGLNF